MTASGTSQANVEKLDYVQKQRAEESGFGAQQEIQRQSQERNQDQQNQEEEMERLEEMLDEAEEGEFEQEERVKKTVRKVYNPRKNVNGIQGRHMPRKVWEPRPSDEEKGDSLLKRLEGSGF